MATKRETIIPKAPIARIFLNSGAKRVSDEALSAMVELLEQKGTEIAQKAIRNSQHAGRKTVHDTDIKLAARQ